MVGFVDEFRKIIGDHIVRLIFYCPRPKLQSANPNASAENWRSPKNSLKG
jgi:hypothetical protein